MKINKRIALSFLTIAATLTAVVGVTFAVFTDNVTLTSNVLTTATPNLKISSDNSCTIFSTSASGISSTLIPGQSDSKNFCLRNESDGTLAFNVTASGHVTSGSLDTSLVSVIVNCGSGDQSVPLNDTDSNIITNILPNGGQANCTITQSLSGVATNGASNRTLHYTVTFTGTQP